MVLSEFLLLLYPLMPRHMNDEVIDWWTKKPIDRINLNPDYGIVLEITPESLIQNTSRVYREKERTTNAVIVPVTSFHTNTVRIKWLLDDGSYYEDDVTIPPEHTREARNEQKTKSNQKPPIDSNEKTGENNR